MIALTRLVQKGRSLELVTGSKQGVMIKAKEGKAYLLVLRLDLENACVRSPQAGWRDSLKTPCSQQDKEPHSGLPQKLLGLQHQTGTGFRGNRNCLYQSQSSFCLSCMRQPTIMSATKELQVVEARLRQKAVVGTVATGQSELGSFQSCQIMFFNLSETLVWNRQ